MSLETKKLIIAVLGFAFLGSLVFVQAMEVARKREGFGLAPRKIKAPANSRKCVECHDKTSPAIIAHWQGSTHVEKGSDVSSAIRPGRATWTATATTARRSPRS